jgi:multidrug efflux pump subunit AcrA (membrane-fusion protein)
MRFKAFLVLLALFTLAGCGALAKTAPPPLPTVVLGNNNATAQASSQGKSGGVTASGVVVPAQEAQLAFTMGESVETVNVTVGDQVEAGQVLVKLDDEALQAQYAQAKAALDTAQANYDLLAAGPTAEQLQQAEAALVMATANYSRTIGGARQEDIDAAQAALNAAYDSYQKVKAGPQEEDIALAKANLLSAEAALKQAQSRYDEANRRDPAGIGGNPAALALEQATNTLNAAKALYDKAAKAPDKAQLSAAYQQVESARAALGRARNPARDFDVTQAKAQVDQAQAQLDALKAGARAQQLDVARSQIASAQAQVHAIEVQFRKAVLKAPFAGTVSRVNIHSGEWVIPGQAILVLADLGHLRIETTDLSERDAPKIEIGQPVTVLIKALKQDVTGRVSDISPLADTLGGDVVYRTTIDLDTRPTGLRAGMSVQVQFGTGQ